MTKMQTFEFGKGRVFIAGLFWQPLPGVAPSAKKAEIEKIAKEQNFDLMVIRTGSASQVGFGSTADGVASGMLSAAAMISKTIEVKGLNRSLLSATEIGDGKWLYFAQREGVILHDGDLLGSEDEIRSRMLTDLSLSEWETIFAPEHWAISGAVDHSFKEFFPSKGSKLDYKKWWALKPVNARLFDLKANWPIVATLVFALVAAYGYSRWQQYKSDQEMIAMAAQQAEQQAEQDKAAANAHPKIEHPWKLASRALPFASACEETLKKVKTLWPGNWSLSDVSCAGDTLAIAWARQDNGWIEHMLEIEPKAVISADGATATLTLPISSNAGEDEALPAEKLRLNSMMNTSQKYGLKLALSTPPVPVALPGDQKNNPLNAKNWKEIIWSVKGSLLPPSVTLELMDGGGFRVNRIQTILVGGVMNWNLEGIQYVQQ